ncbi:Hsp20/alpha crystallin family protein [Halopenitus sp. H-Gu1]|uniref:Hsp20/alpha crystallin family protein n=1 Tax=Halopenitus sp. H-Gu1 TaxID=3242697 RepID=UPI00359DB214
MPAFLSAGRKAVRSVLERIGRGWGKFQEHRPLDHDLLEGEDAYLVVFDAPGIHGEDVDVRFVDRTIEVALERPLDRERRSGFDLVFPGRGRTLTGNVTLPAEARVTPRGANATVTRAGTLEVEIPKTDASADE